MIGISHFGFRTVGAVRSEEFLLGAVRQLLPHLVLDCGLVPRNTAPDCG